MTLYTIFFAASKFIQLVEAAIFVYCLLTWIAPASAVCGWLRRFIDPFCAPFRGLAQAICRRWGVPLDFTCLFAMIGLSIVNQLMWMLYGPLARLFY